MSERDRPPPSNCSGQSYSVMSEEADVYVVGAGPEDNARLLDKQGPLEAAGLRRAAEVGRGGRGVAVVVPPGNGGARGDSCAFDGMVSGGERGRHPERVSSERYLVAVLKLGMMACWRHQVTTATTQTWTGYHWSLRCILG